MHEELTTFLFATEPEINANSLGITETKLLLYPDNTFSFRATVIHLAQLIFQIKRVNEEPRTEE